jgi:uncharacterized membrane protein YdbT with pleckstrin-like domain
MPEETVWRGSPSQWRNSSHFFLYAVLTVIIAVGAVALGHLVPLVGPLFLVLLLLPLFLVLKEFLQTRSVIYELTTERLKTTTGIFSKITDTLELYRVKDLETRQPFFLRLMGLEDVHLQTSDSSSPVVVISAVPKALGLGDKTRNAVEAIRMQKRVREIDIE